MRWVTFRRPTSECSSRRFGTRIPLGWCRSGRRRRRQRLFEEDAEMLYVTTHRPIDGRYRDKSGLSQLLSDDRLGSAVPAAVGGDARRRSFPGTLGWLEINYRQPASGSQRQIKRAIHIERVG